MLAARTPVQGDLQGFFGGLGGGRVAVGDTWTTSLPQTSERDFPGTIHWTLASVAGTTARLEFSGRLEQKQLPLPRLSPGKRALLEGDVSGYVLMERDTGWPLRGRSTVTAVVTMSDSGVAGSEASRLLSLSVVTRFEPER